MAAKHDRRTAEESQSIMDQLFRDVGTADPQRDVRPPEVAANQGLFADSGGAFDGANRGWDTEVSDAAW